MLYRVSKDGVATEGDKGKWEKDQRTLSEVTMDSERAGSSLLLKETTILSHTQGNNG